MHHLLPTSGGEPLRTSRSILRRIKVWCIQYSILAFFLVAIILSILIWYPAFSCHLDSIARESIRLGSFLQFVAALISLFVAIMVSVVMPADIDDPWYFRVFKRRKLGVGLLILAVILFLGGIIVQVLGTSYFAKP